MKNVMTPTEREFEFIRQCYGECAIPICCDAYDYIEYIEYWVTAEDGVKLRTVCYRPSISKRVPVVFQRFCYPQKEPIMRLHAEEFC